jgi:FkbM family methyltransferase
MKHILKKVTGLARKPHRRYMRSCFSQEGEDMILERIFRQRREGFYIDVGAHHAFSISNTFKFYKKGWRGINIDATPGSMRSFRKYRPADINLEVAVSNSSTPIIMHIFENPAYNTADATRAKVIQQDGVRLIEEVVIESLTLKQILDEYVPKFTQIDYMSVDVEGFDLEVLMSNDWETYKPRVILVECLDTSLERIKESKVYSYLAFRGYELVAKTYNTVFFQYDVGSSDLCSSG